MSEVKPKNPIQPLVTDPHGVVRFKANALVRALLDHSTETGLSLNELAIKFDDDGHTDDWQQLSQLIGYSLCGYGDLDYVSDEAYSAAAESMRETTRWRAEMPIPFTARSFQHLEAVIRPGDAEAIVTRANAELDAAEQRERGKDARIADLEADLGRISDELGLPRGYIPSDGEFARREKLLKESISKVAELESRIRVLTAPETVERCARAIQQIEHGGWHTWESCTESARNRAARQARAVIEILTEGGTDG